MIIPTQPWKSVKNSAENISVLCKFSVLFVHVEVPKLRNVVQMVCNGDGRYSFIEPNNIFLRFMMCIGSEQNT